MDKGGKRLYNSHYEIELLQQDIGDSLQEIDILQKDMYCIKSWSVNSHGYSTGQFVTTNLIILY